MATAEAPPAAQCAVHMAEPEGAAPAFLASGSPDKPCLSPAPRHERRVPFPKRWGTERARQLGFLLLQRFCLFICFRRKFGRLLTKLFGLNHVSPNARSGRGRASRPLCISECFHRSAVPGQGFFMAPLPSPRTPYPALRWSLVGGLRGKGRRGARYQSGAGKPKRAAKAAPLSINAFPSSKLSRRKIKSLLEPSGEGTSQPVPPRRCAALQVSCRCAPSPRPPAGDTPPRRAPDPYWPPPSSPPPCLGRRAPTAPPGKRLAGGDPREGVGGLPRDGIECPRGLLGPRARRHGAGRGARCPPGTCPPPPGPRPPSERCRRLSSIPAPGTASPLGGFAARAEVLCGRRGIYK